MPNPFLKPKPELSQISNLSDVQAYLNVELTVLAERLSKELRAIKEIVASGVVDKRKMLLLDSHTNLLNKILTQLVKNGDIKQNITVEAANIPDVIVPEIKIPNIVIPEIKIPTINVPKSIVNVDSPKITVEAPDLKEIERMLEPIQRLEELIPLMTEFNRYPEAQQTLLEELAKESNRHLANMGAVFSGGPSGMSKDEYKAAVGELYFSTNATNTYSTVGTSSSSILSANGSRISAILTNDSDSTIYLSLGSSAYVGRGIRVNDGGGSVTINDFKGIIYAISTGMNKNLCISEVY